VADPANTKSVAIPVAALRRSAARRKANKYGAKSVTVNGQAYRSKRELKRHTELQLLERAGLIADLRREVPFELLGSQRRDDGSVEQSVTYVADYVYRDREKSDQLVVEDVKSKATRTRDYIIKRKLMLREHGITIREIYR